MKTWLVNWSLYPAYGDPQGSEIVLAESEESAKEDVETTVRRISKQGEFKAMVYPIDRYSKFINECFQYSKDDLPFLICILKAILRKE